MPTPDQVGLVVLEITQTDGLSFSLCAMPLDIVRSYISEYTESESQKGGMRQIGKWRSRVFRTGVGVWARGVSK